jgi:subtilisin family serine protease
VAVILLPPLFADDAPPDSGTHSPDAHPALQRITHLARLGVDRWHAAFQRGRGVKIAVLDSGFRGYRKFLGKALPDRVTVRSFRGDRALEAKDSQHGILCAEVLHALAPDAELLLANWEPDRSDQFLEAVRWARAQGARILSCSVIMPSWSDGEGGGPVHESLTRLLGDGTHPGDLLCFASAGNTAQRHWSGMLRPARDGWHQWTSGVVDNDVTPWGTDCLSIEACWSTSADYDLVVLDAVTGREIGRSLARPGASRWCAVVRFEADQARDCHVRLRQVRGEPSQFHLVALGGSMRYSTAKCSVPFPGDGPEVVAVGAVDATGQRVDYSSCGPISTRHKPDLVASVPFPSSWRPRPFSGTSAAAPQAAGLAALVWSRHPGWTARQVRDSLLQSARDLGPPGPDDETGYGLIELPGNPLP